MTDWHSLIDAARAARDRARAPYSGFAVGAALRTTAGRIVAGGNVESASYGLSMCAERVALFTWLSQDVGLEARSAMAPQAFVDALLVYTEAAIPTAPCGACRQVLWEYCGDIPVLLANASGVVAQYRLTDLLPVPFDARSL